MILAIDGLQPDVGHEVLWVIRDCLSGEVLLARSLLLGPAAGPGRAAGRGPATPLGCRSPGSSPTASTRSARRSPQALPGVPHQLCQFHYLREAARPIYEADRHAKKELKKKVRGVRADRAAGRGPRPTRRPR